MERNDVSKLNVIYEKKKRIHDDLENQLEYMKKNVYEKEIEIEHGIEKKLPIEVEKEYNTSHQQIRIKIQKI